MKDDVESKGTADGNGGLTEMLKLCVAKIDLPLDICVGGMTVEELQKRHSVTRAHANVQFLPTIDWDKK